MQYIHGFKTEDLINLGITHDESLILKYLKLFMDSNKMTKMIKDGEVYYWISYDKVVKDLAILGLKKGAISDTIIYDLCEKPSDWEERFEKMSASSKKKRKNSKFIGLFKRFTKKDADGTYSFFCPTDKFYSLIPSITDNDEEMKIPTKTYKKEEAKEVKKVKEFKPKQETSEVATIIKNSDVNIKKTDIEQCEKEFTDMDKLTRTLSNMEKTNSHGIKALRNAYNKVDEKQANTVKTRFHNINSSFDKYAPNELEDKLLAMQKKKFK